MALNIENFLRNVLLIKHVVVYLNGIKYRISVFLR